MNADKAEQGLEPEVGLHSEITGVIIGAAQRVHNTLGHGFLEKVYENALAISCVQRVSSSNKGLI